MEITAVVVKQLREKTGVGMMECKTALVEARGDLAEAEKILRKKGLASAANKAGRAAGEGVVAAAVKGATGVLVEVNCETDFAARGSAFQGLVADIVAHASAVGAPTASSAADPAALDALLAASHGDGTFKHHIDGAIAKIGENILLRRFVRFEAGEGALATYIHTGSKIGVMVQARAPRTPQTEAVLRDVAMHIAAAAPRFVRRDEVSEKVLADEREIAREQALKAGKPPQVVEKIVEGRMEKYFGEACLLEQPFVKDPDKTVKQLLGEGIAITRFARFVLGESV
jgi:elongation factor Ts